MSGKQQRKCLFAAFATFAAILAAGAVPAQAGYIFGGGLLYAVDENATGYRTLTSLEPAAGAHAPLVLATFYPEPSAPDALEFSYSEEEGPDFQGRNATLILHANIPLKP